MPSTSIEATSTTTITIKPAIRTKLLKSLRVYAELSSQRKAIELAMDKCKAAIEEVREETGEQSLALEGYTVTLVAPLRSTLDKGKLIAQGVTMEQIEKATVTKATKAYVKVTCPGVREDE